MTANPRLLRLDVQVVWRAFARAWAKTGKRIAAKIAMIAITTSSSISVKPFLCKVDITVFSRIASCKADLRDREGEAPAEPVTAFRGCRSRLGRRLASPESV